MFSPILLHAHNPGPMTGSGNNTYLVAEAGNAVLIDAGVGNARHLGDLNEALAASQSRLNSVLVTHGHPDHASGAPALASLLSDATFAKRPWPQEDDRYAVNWTTIDEGDEIQVGDTSIAVLHTPGHSPDHLAFWHDESGTVFTGDLVTLGSSVMIHWSRGGDLAQYLASLERLLLLDPRVLLPAHGAQIDEPREVLQGYLEHRRMRERQVEAALQAGPTTVQAIAESIYHGIDPALMRAAQENVRAHLEKLRAEGRAFVDLDWWRR